MTYITWRGGTGAMRTGSNWIGGVAPIAGDTAEIDSGTVQVHGEGGGINVHLAGTGGTNPTLSLQNSSVNVIQLGGLTRLPEAGSITVTGNASVGGISEGGLRLQPGHLTIKLAPRATFTNVGNMFVVNGSTLTESGGAHSLFVNNGSLVTWSSTDLKFGSDVIGTGTILDGGDIYGLRGGKIEFGGAVGAGQTITLDSGTLLLDKPMAFHAVIAHMNTAAPPAYDPTRGLANGAIVLEHTRANHALLTSTELVLKAGNVTVADLHFSSQANIGTSGLFLTNEKDGSTAVSGYALPGSHAIHVSTMPTFLS